VGGGAPAAQGLDPVVEDLLVLYHPAGDPAAKVHLPLSINRPGLTAAASSGLAKAPCGNQEWSAWRLPYSVCDEACHQASGYPGPDTPDDQAVIVQPA